MEAIQLLATLALAAAAAWSAWAASQSVDVMQRSLVQAQLPHMALQFAWRGEHWGGVRITNVGQGTAFDAHLSVEFVPSSTANRPVKKTGFRLGAIPPGRRVWVPGPEVDGVVIGRQELAHKYDEVVLTGEVRDSMGTTHTIKERMADLRAFDDLHSSGVELADDRLEGEISHIAYVLYGIERTLDKMIPRDDEAQQVGPPSDDDLPF